MLTPFTNGSQKSSSSQISKLAKAFADSLNTHQVSDFLVWFLYYDVVELPVSPDLWYSTVTNMDMRGWVALGNFLANTPAASDTGYGLDLVMLDSICDRMDVQRSTVHTLLTHFASPDKMAYSQSATAVNQAKFDGFSYLGTLEKLQSKLSELNRLASSLKPTEGSNYDRWHAIILKRIRGLLHLVIGPRIANLRSGAPLVTAAMSDHLPTEVTEGVKLSYVFEALQPQRQVPLDRYGIHPSTKVLGLMTPPTSPPAEPQLQTSTESERARTHATQLMAENQNLRAQLAALEHDKEKLQESNEKLARKVHTLGHLQTVDYIQSSAHEAPPPSCEIDTHQSSDLLQVSNPRSRPRSLSHDAGEKLAAALDKQVHLTGKNHHKRQHSDVLSWKYEEVFSGLDKAPVPSIRLSDPKTGELGKPTRPPLPERSPSHAISFMRNTGRRSGMVFTKDQMNLLAVVRGATPEPNEEDNKGGDGVEDLVATPTPGARPRSKLKQMNERAQDWAWE
jgi:hypothetical protein